MFSSTGMPSSKALLVATFLLVAATIDALPTTTAAVEEVATTTTAAVEDFTTTQLPVEDFTTTQLPVEDFTTTKLPVEDNTNLTIAAVEEVTTQPPTVDSTNADADDANKKTTTEAPVEELTTTSHEDSADNDTISTQEAVTFLAKYGYMVGNEQNNTKPLSSMDLSRPLRMMQQYAGLRETGELDAPTVRAMRSRRCGVSDNAREGMLSKRYDAITKWEKKKLFYKRNNMPTHTINLNNPTQVDAVVTRSFKHWSDVADLNFKSVKNNNNRRQDINIDFLSGRHGDGNPFDGRGKTLAHAYMPPDGRLHMDDDEKWSIDTPAGTDMHQVMTHELGHILGLGHSRDRNAVMFAYYKYKSNFKLGQDDVEGIQYLYGAKKGSDKTTRSRRTPHTDHSFTTTTTTTTASPATTEYYYDGGDTDEDSNWWWWWWLFG